MQLREAKEGGPTAEAGPILSGALLGCCFSTSKLVLHPGPQVYPSSSASPGLKPALPPSSHWKSKPTNQGRALIGLSWTTVTN